MNSAREYSSKINEMTKNTAESLLEMGLVFVDAKKNLDDSQYIQFLQETSYKRETPMVRKWNRIGDSYIRLKPISNLLPPTVSVLYKLTQLPAQKIDQLVKDHILNPSVTLKEIDDSLKTVANKKITPIVTLKFDPQIDEGTFSTLVDVLNSLTKENPIELKLNADAESIYQSASTNNIRKVA
jgi:hypothetical protein